MNDVQSTRRKVEQGLKKRYRKERLLRYSGLVATLLGVAFLVVFFATLIMQGRSAFQQTYVALDVEFSVDLLAPDGMYDPDIADFDGVVRNALRAIFPEVRERRTRRDLNRLVSVGAAYQLRDLVEADPELIGTRQRVMVPASADRCSGLSSCRPTAVCRKNSTVRCSATVIRVNRSWLVSRAH